MQAKFLLFFLLGVAPLTAAPWINWFMAEKIESGTNYQGGAVIAEGQAPWTITIYRNGVQVASGVIGATQVMNDTGNQYITYTAQTSVPPNLQATRIVKIYIPNSTAPSAPTQLTASNFQSTQFTLSWTASGETTNDPIHYYEIYQDGYPLYAISPTAQPGVVPAPTSYTLTGLTPNATHSYTVRAWDWAGNVSEFSAPLSVTPDSSAPTTPGTVSISSITPTTASASWGASSDNVGVTGYEVKLLQGVAVISTQNTAATNLGFSGLTAGTAYGVSVVAYDAAGNRSGARTGSFITAANPDPNTSVPTNLVASSVTTSGFVLSWNPVVNGATISHYEVERDGVILPFVAGQSNELYRSITGLSAGATYTMRVRSVDSISQVSPWSAPLAVTTAMAPVSLPSSVTRPTGSGTIIGTLGGALSVDNRGSANYSIPLPVTPGRPALQPALSLSYSSSGGNGPLGIGWSLATGFPQAITRGRSILARDGEARGVAFTSADKFYLDGKRLICTSEPAYPHGAPNSTYRTEVDSFVTVTAFGSGGIDRFEVVDKAGTRMTFGKLGAETDAFQRGGGESGDVAYSYALKRVEDAVGNYLTFTYQNLGEGEYVLQKIEGGPDINPAARVEFSYEARTDQPTLWRAGRSFASRARLAVITAWHGSATVAAFGLNYEYAPNAGPSRLTSIGAVLADPASGTLRSVPATQLGWQTADNKPAAASALVNPGTLSKYVYWGDYNADGKDETQVHVSSTSVFRKTGDINGDGITDYVEVTLSNNPGGLNFTASCATIDEAALRALFYDHASGTGTSEGLPAEREAVMSRITLADFTGDGRADLLVHGFDGHLYLMPSLGNSFGAPIKSTAMVGGALSVHVSDSFPYYPYNLLNIQVDNHWYIQPMPCDLNGDGLMDYVFTSSIRDISATGGGSTLNHYWAQKRVTAVLATPDGHFSPAIDPTGFAPYSAGVGTPNTTMKLAEVFTGVLPGDFNGDGLTDLLVRDNKPNAADSNAFGIMGYRWLLLISKGQDASGRPSFEHVVGPVPNSFTSSGSNLPTYFKPVTDAVWNTMNDVNTALTTPYAPLFAGIESTGAQANTFAMDVNHDGLDDFVWYVERDTAETLVTGGNKGWWAMLSTGRFASAASPGSPGTGFSAPVKIDGIPAEYGRSATGGYYDFETTGINHDVDTDGDGHRDWVLQIARNGSTATGHAGYLHLDKAADRTSPAVFGNVLTAVTDGLGRATAIAYKAAKDDAVYTPGAAVSYPIRELRASTPVVSDVWHDSGATGSPAQFAYQYSGNRLDLSGRGSLGFHSFVTLDEQTGLFKYQFLAQSFPMTGLTHREETYRWWRTGGQDKFRYISSHDNTVVFDKVSTSGGATLWPFISKAIEYRWEDSPTAHFSFAQAPANSQPESLFTQAKPAGAHIAITAQSLFDNQSAVQLTLPGVTGYSPSDFNGSANGVRGTATFAAFSGLPGNITYGNLKQLSTDFGGGFTETVATTYKSPVGALTGLVATVTTTVVSPGYGTETAPVKRYNYWGSTPLVADETIDATDNALDLKTTYTRAARGRVTNTQVTNTTATGLQAIGDYSVSSATAFDDRWDQPATTRNAAPYLHPTTIAYHAFLGLPTSVTDVNGAQVTTAYDALGRAVVVTDVLKGLSTTSAYALDATQTVSPPSGVGGIALTSAYKVTVTATVKPTVVTYYDRLGRAIRTIKAGFNGQQVIADTAYNVLGQVVATSLPYPSGGTVYWTKTTYDFLGRVATVTAPNGTVTTNTYIGRATKVSVDAPNLGGADPAAQVNTTLVDAKGRTVKVWNADNVPTFSDTIGSTGTAASIAFALDGFGRMRATTLLGQTATITATYDALGRQLTLNDPDKGNWTYVNNALGQVVSQTDAKGNLTTSTFDRLGRPLTRTTAGGGVTETAGFYYYDTGSLSGKPNTVAKGTQGWIGAPEREEVVATGAGGYQPPLNPITQTPDPVTNLHYYDNKGRPSLELAKSDGKWFYTTTSYDTYSRPSGVRHYWKTAGDGTAAVQPYVWEDFGYVYAYDAKSYLLSLTDSLGRDWWSAPTYDYLDRVTSVKKGNGYTTTRMYRPEDGVLTAITTGSLQNMSFGFDGLGNLRSRTDAAVSGGTESFGYDNLNRLTGAGNTGTVGYFANGNIQAKGDVLGTASGTYTYDSTHPHAVASAFGFAMTYDPNGNLLTRTKTGDQSGATWTGFDKPRTMWRVTPSAAVGSEFHYNASRSRVMQLEFDDVSGTFPAQTPSHYNRKRVYALGSTLELNYNNAVTSGSGTNWKLDVVRIYVPGPDGIIGAREFKLAPITGATSEKTFVYHYDHLGSITAISDWGATGGYSVATGNKAGRYSEDAWGQRRNPLTWSGAVPVTADDGGFDSLTPRGFTGHEMLDDLGLVHMNGRIYDPLLGRFLSADVVVQAPGNLQSYNRYTYVLNNPLALIDPSGFLSETALGAKLASYGTAGSLVMAKMEAQSGKGVVFNSFTSVKFNAATGGGSVGGFTSHADGTNPTAVYVDDGNMTDVVDHSVHEMTHADQTPFTTIGQRDADETQAYESEAQFQIDTGRTSNFTTKERDPGTGKNVERIDRAAIKNHLIAHYPRPTDPKTGKPYGDDQRANPARHGDSEFGGLEKINVGMVRLAYNAEVAGQAAKAAHKAANTAEKQAHKIERSKSATDDEKRSARDTANQKKQDASDADAAAARAKQEAENERKRLKSERGY